MLSLFEVLAVATASQLRTPLSHFQRRLITRTNACNSSLKAVKRTLPRLEESNARGGKVHVEPGRSFKKPPRRAHKISRGSGDDSQIEESFARASPGNETISESKKKKFADGQKKLLSPYELCRRVGVLCSKGQQGDAIVLVKAAPLAAQNAVVWANIIRPVMMSGRYQEGYRLFTDMKRRGIRPTSRTYGTLLKCYTGIENWDEFSAQLSNVCNIFDQLKRYYSEIQQNGGPETELSNIPYNLLINIFAKAQEFQRMYDVFNTMPLQGPQSPDVHTYTSIIAAIGNRNLSGLSTTLPKIPETEESSPSPTQSELSYKNATDAKLTWRQMLRAGIEPDSHAIRAVLKPLFRGRPSDQSFALDIVHQYLGLSRPGDQILPAKLALHEQTLEHILQSCNQSQRRRLTLHYIQQIIDSNRAFTLTKKHMDYALEAHAALATVDPGEAGEAVETLKWMLRMFALPPAPGPDGGIGLRMKPDETTYDHVALACWYGGDWSNMCLTFELMTGYPADQFRDDMKIPPQSLHRDPNRWLRPSTGFMSSMIRSAAKTGSLGNIVQTLNIFQYYDMDSLLELETTDARYLLRSEGPTKKQVRDRTFFIHRLADALTRALPLVINSNGYERARKALWADLLRRVEKIAKEETQPQS